VQLMWDCICLDFQVTLIEDHSQFFNHNIMTKIKEHYSKVWGTSAGNIVTTFVRIYFSLILRNCMVTHINFIVFTETSRHKGILLHNLWYMATNLTQKKDKKLYCNFPHVYQINFTLRAFWLSAKFNTFKKRNPH
jgi:hypothetical protein